MKKSVNVYVKNDNQYVGLNYFDAYKLTKYTHITLHIKPIRKYACPTVYITKSNFPLILRFSDARGTTDQRQHVDRPN